MFHVGDDNILTKLIDHTPHFLHTFFIGGDLRFQVGNILIAVTRRVGATAQHFANDGLAEAILVD